MGEKKGRYQSLYLVPREDYQELLTKCDQRQKRVWETLNGKDALQEEEDDLGEYHGQAGQTSPDAQSQASGGERRVEQHGKEEGEDIVQQEKEGVEEEPREKKAKDSQREEEQEGKKVSLKKRKSPVKKKGIYSLQQLSRKKPR